MKFNIKEAEVIVICRQSGRVVRIALNGKRLEQVCKVFIIWEHDQLTMGNVIQELEQQMVMIKLLIEGMSLTRTMNLSVTKKNVKTVVWSVLRMDQKHGQGKRTGFEE